MNSIYETTADLKNYRYFKRKNAPCTRLHFHAAQELILVKSGSMSAIIDGKSFVVHAGEGVFIHPFLPHAFSHDDEKTEVFIFVADEQFFRPALSFLGGIPPTRFVFNAFELLNRLADDYRTHQTPPEQDAAFCGMLTFVLSAVAAKNELLCQPKAAVSETVCSVLHYVSRHFCENLTLGVLAEKFGYSPQHFSRFFHKHLQINLTEHVNAVRITHAQELLEAGAPVTAAAFASGFSSLETFYRVYKRTFGTSPLANNRKENAKK